MCGCSVGNEMWFQIGAWIMFGVGAIGSWTIIIKEARKKAQDTHDFFGVIFETDFFLFVATLASGLVGFLWPIVVGGSTFVYIIGLIVKGEWDLWNS